MAVKSHPLPPPTSCSRRDADPYPLPESEKSPAAGCGIALGRCDCGSGTCLLNGAGLGGRPFIGPPSLWLTVGVKLGGGAGSGKKLSGRTTVTKRRFSSICWLAWLCSDCCVALRGPSRGSLLVIVKSRASGLVAFLAPWRFTRFSLTRRPNFSSSSPLLAWLLFPSCFVYVQSESWAGRKQCNFETASKIDRNRPTFNSIKPNRLNTIRKCSAAKQHDVWNGLRWRITDSIAYAP